jgi:glutamate N-acetyltransferase / amino-acid N-acetyltransferase
VTVTAPEGFRACGVAAGISGPGVLDLALVVNDGPGRSAAGVFTSNESPAAPVLWSRQVLTSGRLRAVVLNSGGANAGTGPAGFQTTHAVAEQVGESLDCGAAEVAVCSTGPVGAVLPRDAVLAGIKSASVQLAGTEQAGTEAATAVQVLSTRPAEALYRDAAGWLLGGFATGELTGGYPAAILLGVLTTDAEVEPDDLAAALRETTATVFDGLGTARSDSANDTVLLLCSGASGHRVGRTELTTALATVCTELAESLRAGAAVLPAEFRRGRAGGTSDERGVDPV